MAARVPVLDLPVGYKKRKLSDDHGDIPQYSQNKIGRVENDDFRLMSEVTGATTSLNRPDPVRDFANDLELNDIQAMLDQNGFHDFHQVDAFLMDFLSSDQTSIDHDSRAAPFPPSDSNRYQSATSKDDVVNPNSLIQPHFLRNPTAPTELPDETQLDYDLDFKELADFFLDDEPSTTKFDDNVINLDDDVCSVINLDDDDDDNSVLQQSLTTVQKLPMGVSYDQLLHQSTNEVKESSAKAYSDVQPGPTMIDSSSLSDSSIDNQIQQYAASDQERTYDDNHNLGISDNLDLTRLIDYEKLDFQSYEDVFDSIRLNYDALEPLPTESLMGVSFPWLQHPADELKESSTIEVVIID
ncbi:hypothetical protein M0R45_008192 [Rubus argutus]|uniref:Uncharacterized protein n=1 Tax=Rubus argutus TaxID=59490 RepID=A0AAW1Y1G6_RUBAR